MSSIWKRLVVTVLPAVLALQPAVAGSFPEKPVTMIVPFAAGGPVDIVARSLAEPMSRVLKQPVIIENAPGAAGTVGTAKAARAAADGYTLVLGHAGTHAFNLALYPKLPYHPLESFRTIALAATMPSVLTVNAASPFDDMKGLIEYARKNPGKLNIGTAGAGSVSHLAAAMLIDSTKIDVNFVPYRGSSPAFIDLIAGNIDALFDTSVQAIPQIRGTKVKPLAVTSAQRLPALPDVATLEEACCRALTLDIWYGLFAPKGTPEDRIKTLEAAVLSSLSDPKFRATMLGADVRIPDLARANRADFEATIRRDIHRFGDLARRANLKAD